MNLILTSKHEEFPFETGTVYSYNMKSTGNPNALAKGYDKENTLTVVLKVAKSLYQSEPIQTIMKWSNEPYNSPTYYRDLALNLKVKENFEMSIVFTHAKMKADVFTDTHLDELTITLTATQKEDKMSGVAFGRELEPTYEKAWDRVNNPPRLNIYIPPMPVFGSAKLEARENAPAKYKPVMISYIANRKNCTARISEGQKNNKKYIEICNNKGEVIKEIHNAYLYEGRYFCSSELFILGFDGWNEREHIVSEQYDTLADAELALGSIHFEQGNSHVEYRIDKLNGEKWKIQKVSNGTFENLSSGLGLTIGNPLVSYCKISGNSVYRSENKSFVQKHEMGAIYDQAIKAYLGDPVGAGDAFSNLEKDTSLGLNENKKKTLIGIGRSMFKNGYELAFIAGMLGNLKHEGQSAGFFESSNYSSAPSDKPDYLQYMDNNHDYRNKYSGQSVVGKSLSELSNLLDKLDPNKRQGFGLGSVQWTFSRTKTLVQVYKEVAGSSDTITFEQAIEAEALMIQRELEGYYNEEYYKIYDNWKKANPNGLATVEAAYSAGVIICKEYERPLRDSSSTRGSTAREVYKIMMGL